MSSITFTSDNINEITKLMNKWRKNGWDLTKKFIKIAGCGNSNWCTVFYESDLDFKRQNDLTTI